MCCASYRKEQVADGYDGGEKSKTQAKGRCCVGGLIGVICLRLMLRLRLCDPCQEEGPVLRLILVIGIGLGRGCTRSTIVTILKEKGKGCVFCHHQKSLSERHGPRCHKRITSGTVAASSFQPMVGSLISRLDRSLSCTKAT
jgi:hypothetical protein